MQVQPSLLRLATETAARLAAELDAAQLAVAHLQKQLKESQARIDELTSTPLPESKETS